MITLRSALFNLMFFLATFVLTLAATVVRWVAPQHVLGFAMLWARVMVACVHCICGIRVEVTGLERIPDGVALIASRHQSAEVEGSSLLRPILAGTGEQAPDPNWNVTEQRAEGRGVMSTPCRTHPMEWRRPFLYSPMAILTVSGGRDGIGEPCA
jgi:hypothetical protein